MGKQEIEMEEEIPIKTKKRNVPLKKPKITKSKIISKNNKKIKVKPIPKINIKDPVLYKKFTSNLKDIKEFQKPEKQTKGQRRRDVKKNKTLKKKYILSIKNTKKVQEPTFALSNLADQIKEMQVEQDKIKNEEILAKRRGVASNNRTDALKNDENLMRQILVLPAFQSNPFGSIKQHLMNKLK